MVDDRRTEEEEEREAPAGNVGDRAFRRTGPGGVLDYTAMMGTLDTTDTGGAYGPAALERLAPIFQVAHAHDMAVAARALDPEDDGVREDQVQVSQGFTVVQGDPEADKRRVIQAAKNAQARVTDGEEFDPRYAPHYDRQAEAERGWAASMANMQPSVPIDQPPAQTPPVPAEVQEVQEEPRVTEEETATVPPPRPASEPKAVPQESQLQEETPTVEPKQFSVEEKSRESDDGEDFQTLWDEASEQVKGHVDEGLTQTRETETDPAPAPDKPKMKSPNRASSKADWIEWALQEDPSLSRDKAESMSRLELIEKYSKNRPNETK